MTGRRVEITRFALGIFAMQVCAVNDATDDEILEVCNRENPSGTSNGWSKVIRKIEDVSGLVDDKEDNLPKPCSQVKNRVHYLIYC